MLCILSNSVLKLNARYYEALIEFVDFYIIFA